MMLVALLAATLLQLANGQTNPCLMPCRNLVVMCIQRNVKLTDFSAIARCIFKINDESGGEEEECASCMEEELERLNCTGEDGERNLDCVDENLEEDDCNTTYVGQEECDADRTCNWCPDYGVCASLRACEAFAPEEPEPVKEKPAKGSKFECKSQSKLQSDDIDCAKFLAKKRCEASEDGCTWVKKVAPVEEQPEPNKDTNTVTNMKQLKKTCKKMFKDQTACFNGCAKARMRRNKCSAPKKPPSSCKLFKDQKMCDMVLGCRAIVKKSGKSTCEGTPNLNV